MDFNLVVVAGKLAVEPELRAGASRLLLTVRSVQPTARVDLLDVLAGDPEQAGGLVPGDSVYAVGALQRRFSPVTGRSRMEVVAHYLEKQHNDG